MKLSQLYEANKTPWPVNKDGSADDRYRIHSLTHPQSDRISRVPSDLKLANIIKSNCSSMVTAMQDSESFVFRGIKVPSGAKHMTRAVATDVRSDRQPVEMDKRVHEMLNLLFVEHGLKATRSNSIFCTAKLDIADHWGTPYVIFMKDGWDGTVFTDQPHDYSFYGLGEIGSNFISNMLEEMSTDELDRFRRLDHGHFNAVEFFKFAKKTYPNIWKEANRYFMRMKPKALKSTSSLIEVIEKGYVDFLLTGSSYIGVKYAQENKAVFDLLGLETKL